MNPLSLFHTHSLVLSLDVVVVPSFTNGEILIGLDWTGRGRVSEEAGRAAGVCVL